jgi:hypothetical protein
MHRHHARLARTTLPMAASAAVRAVTHVSRVEEHCLDLDVPMFMEFDQKIDAQTVLSALVRSARRSQLDHEACVNRLHPAESGVPSAHATDTG